MKTKYPRSTTRLPNLLESVSLEPHKAKTVTLSPMLNGPYIESPYQLLYVHLALDFHARPPVIYLTRQTVRPAPLGQTLTPSPGMCLKKFAGKCSRCKRRDCHKPSKEKSAGLKNNSQFRVSCICHATCDAPHYKPFAAPSKPSAPHPNPSTLYGLQPYTATFRNP